MLLLPAVALLAGCSSGKSSLNPVDWWHNLEGGKIAEERPAPPGADAPYPNLATVPSRPAPPDKDAMKQLTAALVADRTNAQHTAEAAPLPDPSSPAASPGLFGANTLSPPPPAPPPAPAGQASASLPAASAPPGQRSAAGGTAAAPPDRAEIAPPPARAPRGAVEAAPLAAPPAAVPGMNPAPPPPAPGAPAAVQAAPSPAAPAATPAAPPAPAAAAPQRAAGASAGAATSSAGPLTPPPAAGAPTTAEPLPRTGTPDVLTPVPAAPAPGTPGSPGTSAGATPEIGLPGGPPPRAAAAGSPPSAAPAGGGARVGFAPGSAALSPEAAASVKQFASSRGSSTIVVTGYGDATGSDVAAQTAALSLGLSRAQAIANALTAAGVPQSAVRVGAEAAGRGARLLLLQ